MHPITLASAALLVAAWAVYKLYEAQQGRKKKSLEAPRMPGPKQYPIIGRIHDLPIQFMWLKLDEWAKTYGPIYYTEMLGAKFIVVSDEKVAEDLLVKRAKYNSDRPMMRSVTDSKSSEGGMEYLPLMGKNRKLAGHPCLCLVLMTLGGQNTGLVSAVLCTPISWKRSMLLITVC